MYTVGNDKNIVNIKAPHDKKADEVVRVRKTLPKSRVFYYHCYIFMSITSNTSDLSISQKIRCYNNISQQYIMPYEVQKKAPKVSDVKKLQAILQF
jgi:hypothetical protein